jgi:hypothetical protein
MHCQKALASGARQIQSGRTRGALMNWQQVKKQIHISPYAETFVG